MEIFPFFPSVFSSVALKFSSALFWLNGFLSKDEGLITFLIRNSNVFLRKQYPLQEKAWTILLPETAYSGNYKGQGENNFGTS